MRDVTVLEKVTLENEFIKFLDNENIREEFDKCLYGKIGNTSLDTLISENNPDGWLSNAFVWSSVDTTNKWDVLNDKWIAKVDFVISTMLGY